MQTWHRLHIQIPEPYALIIASYLTYNSTNLIFYFSNIIIYIICNIHNSKVSDILSADRQIFKKVDKTSETFGINIYIIDVHIHIKEQKRLDRMEKWTCTYLYYYKKSIRNDDLY